MSKIIHTNNKVMTASERADFREHHISQVANASYEDKRIIWCVEAITRKNENKSFFIQTENADEAREFSLQWIYALLAQYGKKKFSYKNISFDIGDFLGCERYITLLSEIPAGYKE